MITQKLALTLCITAIKIFTKKHLNCSCLSVMKEEVVMINWLACISESLVGDQITIVLGCIYFPGVYVPWCNDNIILSHVQCFIIIKYEHCHVSLTHIWTIDIITIISFLLLYFVRNKHCIFFTIMLWEQSTFAWWISNPKSDVNCYLSYRIMNCKPNLYLESCMCRFWGYFSW